MKSVYVDGMGGTTRSQVGEAGELIVTRLCNRASPLNPYPVGDLGRCLPEPCNFGRRSQLFEVVKERTSELLLGPKGIPVLGGYFVDFFDESSREVFKFHVPLTGRASLRIVSVPTPAFGKRSRHYLLDAVAGKSGDEMELEFEYVGQVLALRSGKHLLTINGTAPAHAGRSPAPPQAP